MKRLAILVSLALAACGGTTTTDANGDGIADTTPTTALIPTDVTEVAPSSPKGHLTGHVQKVDGTAIAGATVTVTGTTAFTATTDTTGFFFVDKLTGGSTVGVFITATGYAPAWTTATIPAAAGNFPLDDGESFVGNFKLMPTTGTIGFYIVGYDGKSVDKVTANLDVTPAFVIDRGSGPSAQGDILAPPATSDTGTLSFTGVPKLEDVAWMANLGMFFNVNYTLYVPPVYDASGNLLYGGATVSLDAQTLLAKPWSRTVVLPAPTESQPLKIVATNVANLLNCPTSGRENLVPKTGPIYVVFNQPIAWLTTGDPKDVFVEVRDDNETELDSTVIGINAPAVNALGTQLQITFKTSPGLVDGQKYNLTIQAIARDDPNAVPVRFSAPFFGGDPTAPKPLVPSSTTININETAANNDYWDMLGNSNAQTMDFIFDKYIGSPNQPLPAAIAVYFDNDLNGNGKVDQFEKGSTIPYCAAAAEPIPAWLPGAKASGYSKRYRIPVGAIPLSKNWLNTDLNPIVAFNESFKCANGTMETVWGEAINSQVTGVTVNALAPTP